MSERETEPGAEAPEPEAEAPEPDDDALREAQEGTGYGEDEGEREAGLERETGWSGGDESDRESGAA